MHALKNDGISSWSPRKLTTLSPFGDTEMASIHPEMESPTRSKRYLHAFDDF